MIENPLMAWHRALRVPTLNNAEYDKLVARRPDIQNECTPDQIDEYHDFLESLEEGWPHEGE